MVKITLFIPDKELEEFRKEFPEVNIAEVARRAIESKVEELEKMEKFKKGEKK
ncbi:hypothetical protein HYW75_06015 [Candidatus Pacearchaeota archaeon]|nr:hypothetical protein [Candidatus Pacearchaeota archaeon]